MKRLILLLLPLLAGFASCTDIDDFAISGTVVAIEECSNFYDQGAAIQIDDSVGNIGADYRFSNDIVYHNVVVVYNADKVLPVGARISGRIYWDDRHSDAYCYWHYRNETGEVPEACFSELNIED